MPIILAIAALVGFSAHADFTVIKDGQEYLCTPSTPLNPLAPQECADKAYAGPYSRAESMDLCSGARNIAPAECAIKAYAGPYSKPNSILLCKGTLDIGPAECAIKAYAGPFSQDESVELCARRGTLAHADCAIRAYAGPYSKAESVAMCKANPVHMLRALEFTPLNENKMREFKDQNLIHLIRLQQR